MVRDAAVTRNLVEFAMSDNLSLLRPHYEKSVSDAFGVTDRYLFCNRGGLSEQTAAHDEECNQHGDIPLHGGEVLLHYSPTPDLVNSGNGGLQEENQHPPSAACISVSNSLKHPDFSAFQSACREVTGFDDFA
jgi:hypothetical protein